MGEESGFELVGSDGKEIIRRDNSIVWDDTFVMIPVDLKAGEYRGNWYANGDLLATNEIRVKE
jgi:hypothetical protein